MEKIIYLDLLEYLIHEVTQLNSVIKASSELLAKKAKEGSDKKAISHHSSLIHENSTVLSYLIDVVNYKLNPTFFERQEKDLRNIHGKFFKTIQSLERRKKDKRLTITFSCECEGLINLYPIFETVPYILLDNAIKYSPKDCLISIEIVDYSTFVKILTKNTGPFLTEEEKTHIFDYGFRGKEAQKMTQIGQGLGLNFLQDICHLHDGKISIVTGAESCKVDNISMCEFQLIIDLPK